MSGEGNSCILQLYPFLTIGEYIEDRHYISSFATSMCNARAILVHTCHSWSRHVLEMWCVGEWGCIVVQKIKAPLQLLPVTEESVFFLNGVDV